MDVLVAPPLPLTRRPLMGRGRPARKVSPEVATLVVEARQVMPHLRKGDRIVWCTAPGRAGDPWMLLSAEIRISDALVSLLKQAHQRMDRNLRAAIRAGQLVPAGDGLPGFGGSQTWLWDTTRRPAVSVGGQEVGGQLYRWFWRAKLPDRRGQVFRVICRGEMNSCLIEFLEDGWRCVTSRNALRKVE